MAGRKRGEVSEALADARDQFAAWRRMRTVGERIPAQLWTLARTLADSHGISRTAGVLKLDYQSLKKRVESASKSSDPASVAGAFVEYSPLPPAVSAECVIELEDGCGGRMRVHVRGCDVPDVVALGRSFWIGE